MLNSEITRSARESLAGNWGISVGTFFVLMVVQSLFSGIPGIGWLAWLILSGPMFLGISIFSLALFKNEHKFMQVFEGFNNFTVSMLAYIKITLFSLLWALLFIIPGIIVYLSYSMTFFILAENPTISEKEAMVRSQSMMEGKKWKLVFLYCRFIGWAILAVFTFGVGYLWLSPYVGISIAKFYEDIKG